MNSPKVCVNCPQLETSVGVLNGPDAANPTKAATAVPTPSIGREPDSTSSTYTPGDRYVGIVPPAFWLCPCDSAAARPGTETATGRASGNFPLPQRAAPQTAAGNAEARAR